MMKWQVGAEINDFMGVWDGYKDLTTSLESEFVSEQLI